MGKVWVGGGTIPDAIFPVLITVKYFRTRSCDRSHDQSYNDNVKNPITSSQQCQFQIRMAREQISEWYFQFARLEISRQIFLGIIYMIYILIDLK